MPSKAPKPPAVSSAEASKEFEFGDMFAGRGQLFASALTKILLRNLNNPTKSSTFYQYTRDQISTFIKNPATNAAQLRNAVVNLYNASGHFRRIINYFAGLTDFSYVVSPVDIGSDVNPEDIYDKYAKTVAFLAGSNLKEQLSNVLITCFREDTYFCTAWVNKDGLVLQQLPSDYCQIASSDGGVYNVSFNFQYFDAYEAELPFYSPEFTTKYKQYKSDTQNAWLELDAPNSFAIKCNSDIPEYAVPPLIGILREVYDLEDYKALKITKTELENYALLVMKLGTNTNGEWMLDFGKAKEFWNNLDSVLPEQIGSVLSPMSIEKIGFADSGKADSDKISEAEAHLWADAGVSGQIFSSDITASRSLEISIAADQAMTWKVVQSIGHALNRILMAQSFSKLFRLVFLDVSRFNRDEYATMLMKTTQYGFPTASLVMATMGVEPLYMSGLNMLETQVLRLQDKFIPFKSANTSPAAGSDTGGAPMLDKTKISDEGERTRNKK